MGASCRNDSEITELLDNLEFDMYSVYENGNFEGFSDKDTRTNPISVKDKFLGKFELSLVNSNEKNNNLRINHALVKSDRFTFWSTPQHFDFVDIV